MKKIQGLLANALIVILLLLLTGVLIITLNKKTSGMNATSQTVPAQTSQQGSPLATPTPSLSKTTEPDFLEPVEPTGTPVIIMPKGTPPPIPTPLPTPTVTPVASNEMVIAKFEVPVGDLVISPDDKTLALVSLVELDDKRFANQIWTVDLTSKKINKFNLYGSHPIWSPDGQHILFRTRDGDEFDIKVVGREGQNEKSVMRLNKQDLLSYYWSTPQQIGIVQFESIVQVDLSGGMIEQQSMLLPSNIKEQTIRRVEQGKNNQFFMLDYQNRTLVRVEPNGTTATIASEQGQRFISDFKISNDKRRIAYVVTESANDELWLIDSDEKIPRKLYQIDSGHIRDILWSSDNQMLLIGWGETGTNVPTKLLWLDIKSGKRRPVGVHNVESIVISHQGDKLYYNRVSNYNVDEPTLTTLYQLEIKQ